MKLQFNNNFYCGISRKNITGMKDGIFYLFNGIFVSGKKRRGIVSTCPFINSRMWRFNSIKLPNRDVVGL